MDWDGALVSGDGELTDPIDLDGPLGEDQDGSPWEIHIDPNHLAAAIEDAAARAHYDVDSDTMTPAFLNDVQGIAAEFIVADALNEAHDGLQYKLFADPSHPEVDIAGVDVAGNIVRLLQVKATRSQSYARSALAPGIEVVTSTDSWTDGMLRYDLSSSALRAMVAEELET